jgi:hypothetical protein
MGKKFEINAGGKLNWKKYKKKNVDPLKIV